MDIICIDDYSTLAHSFPCGSSTVTKEVEPSTVYIISNHKQIHTHFPSFITTSTETIHGCGSAMRHITPYKKR